MDVDMDDDDDDERKPDPDAMDIDRSSPVKLRNEDGHLLRPQRFFAPEEPTGLENLFARTIRLADTSEQNGRAGRSTSVRGFASSRMVGSLLRDRRIWLSLAIVPLLAFGYKAWDVYRQRSNLVTVEPSL